VLQQEKYWRSRATYESSRSRTQFYSDSLSDCDSRSLSLSLYARLLYECISALNFILKLYQNSMTSLCSLCQTRNIFCYRLLNSSWSLYLFQVGVCAHLPLKWRITKSHHNQTINSSTYSREGVHQITQQKPIRRAVRWILAKVLGEPESEIWLERMFIALTLRHITHIILLIYHSSWAHTTLRITAMCIYTQILSNHW